VLADDPYRIVTLTDGTELSCKALLIATGVTIRKLDAPGVERLTGAGVYYGAALTEAAHYRGEPVFVIGGANSAGQAAMFISRYANQVSMLVRSESLSANMSQYLIDQINATSNIQVLTDTEVMAVHGEEKLEALTYCNKATRAEVTVPAAAMFIFIGALPHTGFINGLIRCNQAGFILTGPELFHGDERPKEWPLKRDPYLLETSLPGVFAAGDVRQSAVRRVASAVGEGAIAVSLIHQYLKTV
jgi:thioredoxin reductase (NADPH)